MNEKPEDNDQKMLFVDSLLDSLYQNSTEKAQSLVTAGMEQLDSDAVVTASMGSVQKRTSTWKLVCIATSAVLLIALIIPQFVGQDNSALAAVAQSLQQSMVDVGRRYTLESTWRSPKSRHSGGIKRNADLYVKGNQQLAVCAKSSFETSIWLGLNKGEAWVVPPIGPVLEGNEEGLIHWASSNEEISTPYLHVSTLLERMKDSYELEFAPDQEVQINGQNVKCRHVVGVLKTKGSSPLPDRIDLKANADNGVAMKLVATWEPESDPGVSRESLKIEFQEDIELNDPFFTSDFHGGKERMRIKFGSLQPTE